MQIVILILASIIITLTVQNRQLTTQNLQLIESDKKIDEEMLSIKRLHLQCTERIESEIRRLQPQYKQ